MPQFWLWTMIGFVAFGVIYWRYAANELQRQKSAVMARQRAFSATLGPRLLPLQERIEAWTSELAADWRDNQLSPRLSLERLSRSKGVYLRLLRADAEDPERLRRAADRSLHDGFSSCLFVREARTLQTEVARCTNSRDCSTGEICNEFEQCAAPTQPFNLRLMYRAVRVLSPAWTDELHQATSDYKVRVFDRDLDAVTAVDVPIALELSSQAQYFTALLDEMPASGLPEIPEGNDLEENEMERLQAVTHPVRLGVWDLESGEQLVRLRTDAGATFIPMGAAAAAPLASQRARQRQVNNCSIAEALRDAVRAGAAREQVTPPGAVAPAPVGAVAPAPPGAVAPAPVGAVAPEGTQSALPAAPTSATGASTTGASSSAP
jgi:hypothetical protein